ncbi:MAG: 3-hydroxyacyl-CoA dehydrogenase NAD-binding domain-containing protein [Omnitrophica bacterium]|nr:3-hydroxyacyl-CoA dehydrogenase NAD-binding domain-containing protein [Candidatus Omnitrophota bacterium]
MKILHLKIKNRIAILEFDQPDSKVNVLNTDSMRELDEIIEQLADKSSSQIKALIITSKKDGIFIAGAEIKEIEQITSSDVALEKAQKGKQIFNKLRNLDLITLAAINGACLGGGLELALACQYRVASFSEKAKIGLPEVNLGLIPGWGGTQRLPRLIGITRALGMILAGKLISAKEAKKIGLVDRLFPETRLLEESLVFVNGLLEGKIRIKRKQKKKPLQIFLENTPLGKVILFSQAKKNVLKKTKGFYPAPLRALEVIRRGLAGDIKRGFRLESEAFGELAITAVAKNLIKLFYLNEQFKKFHWVDQKINPAEINKCAVVGAGLMGGGIAQLVSFHDIPTRVKDINYQALKTALKTADKLFRYAVKKKKLKKHQAEYKFGLISPTITYHGFKNTDLVIEAVVENLEIKQKVFKELSKVAAPTTIFASNTSALAIIKMGEASGSPEKVAGLHFFNPVHRMPLVEIIKSEKTSDETLATLIAFARKIGKVVIVVRDVPGFLINRILISYLIEAAFLLEEGIKIEQVDEIARAFGLPMGPIELVDEIGIDVSYKVVKILEQAYGARMRTPAILETVKQEGFLGKRTKLGFYIYRGKIKIPNPKIYKLIKGAAGRLISGQVALKRMIYVMINEAARCLEEKVVTRPETIDLGMIMGTGFPPFRAGLLSYADTLGSANIVRELQEFEKDFGAERFKPCSYLLQMAKNNEKFFG